MMNFISMWRSTRVLDGRKVGGADRSQSVVHALLSARDQAPMETPPAGLRQRIAHSLEDTRPFTPSAADAWLPGSLRAGALVMALLALSGLVIWTTNSRAPQAPQEVAEAPNDDPDPDLLSAAQSGSTSTERTSPQTDRRSGSEVAALVQPRESVQAQQDIEKLASTFMQAFPVRREEPR